MKCLLLVYGEYRSADVATKTWNILNNNVDVVVRTQNQSNHYSEALRKQHGNHKIVKNDITKLFGDCEIQLEPLDEWMRDNPNNDRNLNIRDFRYLYKRVSDKIDNYDVVAISRLDSTFYIHDFERFLNEYDKETIYVNQKVVVHEKGKNFIQDHCYFGSSKVIGNFLKNLPTEVIDSHYEIADYILENFKHQVWDGFSSIHLRLSMKPFFEKHFSVNGKIKNKDDEYLQFFRKFMNNTHLKLERIQK